MGAKASFVAYFDTAPKHLLATHSSIDLAASRRLAEGLFPDTTLEDSEVGTLAFLSPPKNHIFAGSYGGLRIVAHEELSIDHPSKIDARWLNQSLGRTAYLHAIHSVVDWFAFALWHDGQLVRSLSVSPDGGVHEQIGSPLAFEVPYWAGQFTVEVGEGEPPYPLPFHPLELAEASMLEHLGFQFEGRVEDWTCDPDAIPIATFSLAKQRSRWKFW